MKLISILLFLTFLSLQAAPYDFYNQSCFRRKSNQKFVLVKNSNAMCPIIVAESVSPRTMEAVKDLQSYLKKISGAVFEIKVGFDGDIPEQAIWIGHHDVLKTIFKKVEFDFKLEEILIVSHSNHLAILGDDGPYGLVKDIVINNRPFADAQSSYGTINAIYTFIQDFLGVRWFWPGQDGEDFIKSKSIEVDQLEFRYIPQFTWRSGLVNAYRPGVKKSNKHGDIWSMRQRLYYSSTVMHAGHAFTHWWGQYHKLFPDVFALTNQGTRTPINDPMRVKLCLTNPKTKGLWLDEVSVHVQSNPFNNFIPANENDSHGTGNCECEGCMALDVISVKQKEQHLSDRHLWFVNMLHAGLVERYPEHKDKFVIFFAYGRNRQTPLKTKVSGNVAVVSVANFHLRRSIDFDLNDPMILSYLNWSKLTNQIFWRPNLHDPVGLSWGFYDIAYQQSFENFKFVAQNNCKGVFFDAYRNHWSTQGIQYYLESQLTWNPYVDRDVLLCDYFNRMYGVASMEMREFWSLVEDTRNSLFMKHGELVARFLIYKEFNDAWFKKSLEIIGRAELKLHKEDDKFKNRLNFTKFGLVYAQEIVSLRLAMHKYESKDIEDLTEIKAISRKLEGMSKSMPDFAINFESLVFNQDAKLSSRLSRRMAGLLVNGDIPAVSKRRIPDFED